MGSDAYRNLGSWETVASRNWLSQELQVATGGVVPVASSPRGCRWRFWSTPQRRSSEATAYLPNNYMDSPMCIYLWRMDWWR